MPLDPVHDLGLRLIKKALDEAGHKTILLPPDLSLDEILKRAAEQKHLDYILVSRTIGYGAAEILARFMDLAEATGLRKKTKIAVGGMGIDVKLAAELGFDAGFPSTTTPDQALSYIENRGRLFQNSRQTRIIRNKTDLTKGFSYKFHQDRTQQLLEDIADQILSWAKNKTSPGIERARIKEEILLCEKKGRSSDSSKIKHLRTRYLDLCDPEIAHSYLGQNLPSRTWKIPAQRVKNFQRHIRKLCSQLTLRNPIFLSQNPRLFVQIGSGSPLMDIVHMKICEAWGADGVITICPSSSARHEGLLNGLLNHEGDGTLLTFQNLLLIKKFMAKGTLWGIRAHRGLNSPEAVLYAGLAKADLTKLNFFYGSLGAGTDPARLVVDTLESIRLSAKFGIPFDVPSNDELGGIPTPMSFAGLLVMTKVALRLGAKPILKPLFCYSPWIILNEYMLDNYVDFNAAKIKALRAIVDAPLWVGEPAGFMTHTEDRIQSAVTTALHIELARSLAVQAVTIASTDEAYSRGVINLNPRLDSMKAVEATHRFLGQNQISPSPKADIWAEYLISKIDEILSSARERKDFIRCLHEGIFGGPNEGVYPGRAGRNTIREKA